MKTHPTLFLVPAIVTAMAGAMGPVSAADAAPGANSHLETCLAPWHSTPLLNGSLLESRATLGEPAPAAENEGFPVHPALTLAPGFTSWRHPAGKGRWQNVQGVPLGLLADYQGLRQGDGDHRSTGGTPSPFDAPRSTWEGREDRVAGVGYAISRRVDLSLTYRSLGVMDSAFGTDDWVDRSKTHSLLAVFKVRF